MREKELSDEEIEEELVKAFLKNDSKKNVFEILRNEDSSLKLKDKKLKFKKKDID